MKEEKMLQRSESDGESALFKKIQMQKDQESGGCSSQDSDAVLSDAQVSSQFNITDQYSSKPNREERIQIRQKYASLLALLEEDKNELVTSAQSDQLVKVLESMNLMNERVKATVDSTLDAKVLKMTADIATLKAKNYDLSINEGRKSILNVHELGRRLKAFLAVGGREGEESETLNQISKDRLQFLAHKAQKFSCGVYTMDFLLGPIALRHKRRMVSTRSNGKVPVGKESQPMIVDPDELTRASGGNKERDITAAKVFQMNELLQNADSPLPYYKFISHPLSFAKSVENMFHSSFLIRDGQASMSLNEQGEPFIEASDEPTESDFQSGLLKKQIISHLTMDEWKRCIYYYKLKTPMIPD